jgi:hypothetical protein
VPAEVEPPELARLLVFAERSRAGDWSLRSALCRYAQPQPKRVSEVLELVRRIDFALHPDLKRLDADGPALWALVESSAPVVGDDERLVGLLRAMVELDRLAETLVDWAADRAGKHPEAEVDTTTAEVTRQLDALGIEREERQRPPRSRG